MKNLKELSDNSLYEICGLCNELTYQLERYSHVSDFLPPSIKEDIDNFGKKVSKEIERREGEV